MADVTPGFALAPAEAWKPYVPSESNPWTLQKVGHLYRRAAFGATRADLERGLTAGPEQTVTALLRPSPAQPAFDQDLAGIAAALAGANIGRQASAWWLYRMLYSPQPLREKLTLFWHNHFATSFAKVRSVRLMLRQYDLLRAHALGNFRPLLQGITTDPAMLVWLDSATNTKGKPNENYARELMELFSLGIGHYTEHDIREAARALTGWQVRGEQPVFLPALHDPGEKTVFGKTGKWKEADVVRACLEQDAAATFITGKLVRFLVGEAAPVTPDLIAPLAARFRKDYDIADLVETILRSNAFFAPEAYRAGIKSPVDFTLGLITALEGRTGTLALAAVLEELGQSLFAPPSVKGWDGGAAWLNGQTLLFRQNFALAVTSTEDPRFGRHADPVALLQKHQKTSDEDALDFFLALFVQNDVSADTRAALLDSRRKSRLKPAPVFWTARDVADQRVRSLCQLVLALPEYQLS